MIGSWRRFHKPLHTFLTERHMGIYSGDRWFLHASDGEGVVEDNVPKYFQEVYTVPLDTLVDVVRSGGA